MDNKDNQNLQEKYDADFDKMLSNKTNNHESIQEDKEPEIEKESIEEPELSTQIESKELDTKKPQTKSDKPKEPEEDSYEYRFNEAQKWGQSKNKAFLSSKRKISEMVNQLKDSGTLEESEVSKLLSSFEASDSDDGAEEEKKIDPYAEVGNKIQKEFENFKRYNKGTKDADARYAAFFNFFPMFTDKEKAESMNYLQDAEDNDAIEYVMAQGGELYDTLYKGVKEKGSVIKYLKDIHKRLEKAESKAGELSSELDSTTKKIYNGSTDSKAKTQGKTPSLEEFYEKRYS